ncbi:MAG: TonB-dependent receptor [Bacteroidales bacterium]|nr:TonB-dependent receptor [Bacteroidales bacterium]
MRKVTKLAFSVLFLAIGLFASAQVSENTVKGFVYDKATGEPVMFSNIYLKGTTYGASTDVNGYFSVTKIPDGEYTILVTFLGYDTISENISLKKNDNISKRYFLTEASVQLDAVQITAEKIEAKTETKTSVINITPKSITKIPTIGGQPDLSQYLQVIPGVIFTGDQGGQLYIRGGAPIQNKVLLDGMIIYNPFHSIGLFSIFDTDIIRNAEVFTGGFGAEFGGRISSVMDITTRDGNKNRLSGKVGASTFGARVLLEGPLKKAKNPDESAITFLISAKNSYLEQTSDNIYSGLLDEKLPYNFQDIYGKLSITAPNGSKINLFGFRFADQVNKYKSISDFSWDSYGGGANFVVMPDKSSTLIDGIVAYSDYTTTLHEENNPDRSSSISGFNAAFNFTYFFGKHSLRYGIEMQGFKTVFDYMKSNGVRMNQTENTTELGAYAKFKGQIGKFIFEPSLRLQWYASLSETSPEPRLALKYNINEWWRIKAAGGIYSQNLIAANSDRDVVNLFYGFLSGQDGTPSTFDGKDVSSKLQKAIHYILGTEFDLSPFTTLNVEGYYKDFKQLTNMNRNQLYTGSTHPQGTPEILWKDFMIENGKAYGIDVSLKYERNRMYFWAAYSLAYVDKNYENEVGELVNYRTHYDRRHNVNLMATYTAGARREWEFSARWNFGSGFPFTMIDGYYEHYQITDVNINPYTASGDLGIIYNDLNKGEMPSYHRLDLDVKRKISFSEHTTLDIDLSVTNVYDHKNIFYVDVVNNKKIYQLPVMPSLGMTLSF